jgi:hypothetical protein
VLIPLGIKIGLDARERLKAEPRGITVHYYTGERAPCPCVADGVMLATQASPGQGTLVIAPEKAAPGLFASIVIRDRKTGEGFRYNIPSDLGPKIHRVEQVARSGCALRGHHERRQALRRDARAQVELTLVPQRAADRKGTNKQRVLAPWCLIHFPSVRSQAHR